MCLLTIHWGGSGWSLEIKASSSENPWSLRTWAILSSCRSSKKSNTALWNSISLADTYAARALRRSRAVEVFILASSCVLMTLQLGETNAPYILSRSPYVISLFGKRHAKLVKCWYSFAYLIFREIKCTVEFKRKLKRCTMQFAQMSKNNDLGINIFENFKQPWLNLN